MTKVLHIVTDSNPQSGGVIEAARLFASEWARQGHQQDLLTLDAPGESFLSYYPGQIFRVGPVRNNKPWNRYRFSLRMNSWLRDNASNYDAVIVSGLWRYQTLGALLGLAKLKIPYFVFTHGMLDPWFKKTYPIKHVAKQISWWIAEGALLKGAKAVIFTNQTEALKSRGAFKPYKVVERVVNLGILPPDNDEPAQVASFCAKVPSIRARPYLLYLSRIHPKKGCDLLIDAFAATAHLQPDLQLVIAGPDQTGLSGVLKDKAEKLGLRERIHFPGMIEGAAKLGAFRGADAFILPSHQENFGIVVVEALSVGTPVLISNQVYIAPEVLADQAGLVDEDTLNGTKRLLENWHACDEASRLKMRLNAAACFERRFHIHQAALQLMDLIRS